MLNFENAESLNFFVWQSDQQQGPFSQETIQRMILEGQIDSETLLCPEAGGLDWTSAKDLFFQNSSVEDPLNLSAVKISQKTTSDLLMIIRLVSGAEFKIKAVTLYDAKSLAEINSKRAEAAEKLRGVTTGIGTIGSIGWVLASSMVIGAVEGVLSAGSASAGNNLLLEVMRLERSLRKCGVICPVKSIENIESPHPGHWRMYSRKTQCTLIHSGDDFVIVHLDDDSIRSIRWNTVESYVYGE